MTNIHLIIHNLICIVSIITTFGMALFTYLNGPRKTANITWTLMLISIAVFITSHLIGVNIPEPNISKSVLMFNLSIFFVGTFNVHAILAITGQNKEKKWLIGILYASALLFTLFFILSPNLFLLPSVPKMYFPNYYEPGLLNWVRVFFLYGLMVPYMVVSLIRAYRTSKNDVEKKQLLYLTWTVGIGYIVGFLPNLLVYDVNFDPAIGMLFVNIFAIPFVFGAVKYKLFNIRVIAQQAFWYSIAVALVGGLITIFNYSINVIREINPGFPIWTTSIGSALLVVTASVIIWQKLRENDIMKYEFITTVTHKFRTPLTHIKWASENLYAAKLQPEEQTQVDYIKSANLKLVELTNLLMNVSEAENSNFDYHFEHGDVSQTAAEVISSLNEQFVSKHVTIERHLTENALANFDASRIRFIIQTFVENAIHYTAANANIQVTVAKEGDMIRCSVNDNGIGISKDEVPLLFSKFYRGHKARLADTEGMGIGLFIAKDIIQKHGGRIWAESAGEDRGSTFTFTIPALK